MPYTQNQRLNGREAAGIVIGVALTVVALALISWSLSTMSDIIGSLIGLSILLYLLGGACVMIQTKSYKDGFSVAELMMFATWPMVIYRLARTAGSRSGFAQGMSSLHISSQDDDSTTVIPSEIGALLLSIAMAVVSGIGAVFMLTSMAANFVLLGVTFWVIAMTFTFWSTRLWSKDGITGEDALILLAGPFGLVKKLWDIKRTATQAAWRP